MTESKQIRVLKGTVISSSRDKTLAVEIVTKKSHPLYKKFVKKKSIFHVHDEKNNAKTGDVVHFVHHRPFSKTKFWLLKSIES